MAKKSFKGSGADLFLTDAPAPSPSSSDVKDLKINPEFKSLIPPLNPEEYAQLEENILQDGIRESISLWNETIIDGHNRYEIALRHGLPFTTVSYEFANESDVILWIVKNQFGRRNLLPYHRSLLALRLKPVIAEQAKINQIEAGGAVPQKSVKAPLDTQKEIAVIAGVSHDTISKVEIIEREAPPEVKEQLRRGDATINKAYQDIKRQHNKGEPAATSIQHKQLKDKYSVIYADPPWQTDDNKRSPSLKVSDLKTMQVPADDNAVLFMWATAPLLKDALDVMAAWGFKYKTSSVWDKKKVGVDFWFKGQHELLLVGVRGTFKAPDKISMVSSVYREAEKNQSKKPIYYNGIIENMFPDEKYLEMFSNQPYSEKWTVWSNEAPENEEGKE